MREPGNEARLYVRRQVKTNRLSSLRKAYITVLHNLICCIVVERVEPVLYWYRQAWRV